MASEYLKWKYRDVKPDQPIELTKQQKRANWWHYHKWYVVLACVLVAVLADLAINAINVRRNAPDIQVAYVATTPLPEDAVAALESALAELAGVRRVQVNQYLTASQGDSDSALYASATSVQLLADLDSRESYLFLLDDPETFQANYEVLRRLDGALAAEADGLSCCLRWGDCPAAALDLGSYAELVMGQQITGESQALLADLYLARRGFWNDRTCKNLELCDQLWDTLTKGA